MPVERQLQTLSMFVGIGVNFSITFTTADPQIYMMTTVVGAACVSFLVVRSLRSLRNTMSRG